MVTSAQVLIENGSVGAVKGILFAIRMAKMIDSASSFWVSVVSIGVRHFSAIESCVGIVSGNSHRFDLFRLVGSFFQHHWTLGFVGLGRSITVMRRRSIAIMLGRPISWGRRRIWSGFMISGLVNRSVWSGLMVVWFRGCVWLRFMVSWLVVCWFRRAVRSRSGKVSFSCGWMVWFGLSIMVRLLIGILQVSNSMVDVSAMVRGSMMMRARTVRIEIFGHFVG